MSTAGRINKSTTKFVPKRKNPSSASSFQRASSATPSISGTPRVGAIGFGLSAIDEFELNDGDVATTPQSTPVGSQNVALPFISGVEENETFAVPVSKSKATANKPTSTHATTTAALKAGGFAPQDPSLRDNTSTTSTQTSATSFAPSSAPPASRNALGFSFTPRDPTSTAPTATPVPVNSTASTSKVSTPQVQKMTPAAVVSIPLPTTSPTRRSQSLALTRAPSSAPEPTSTPAPEVAITSVLSRVSRRSADPALVASTSAADSATTSRLSTKRVPRAATRSKKEIAALEREKNERKPVRVEDRKKKQVKVVANVRVGERRSTRTQGKQRRVEPESGEEEEESESESEEEQQPQPPVAVVEPPRKRGRGRPPTKSVKPVDEDESEAPVRAPKRRAKTVKKDGMAALLAAATAADDDEGSVHEEEDHNDDSDAEEEDDDDDELDEDDEDDASQTESTAGDGTTQRRKKRKKVKPLEKSAPKKRLKDLDPTSTTMSDIATGRDQWDGRVSKRGLALLERHEEVKKKRRLKRQRTKRHLKRRQEGLPSDTEDEEEGQVMMGFIEAAHRRGDALPDGEDEQDDNDDDDDDDANDDRATDGDDDDGEELPDSRGARRQRRVEIESPEPEATAVPAGAEKEESAVPDGANGDNGGEDDDEEGFAETNYAPQVRFVNGEFVVDEASLEVDRALQARNGQVETLERVEESALDRYTNSSSWGKGRNASKWNARETEKFYDALRQFGTDFEMIAGLFPSRSRRQIKSKWVKEDRENPKRITAALMNKKEIDLDHYAALSGQDLSGPVPEDPMDRINKAREETEKLERENSVIPGGQGRAFGGLGPGIGRGRQVELEEVEEEPRLQQQPRDGGDEEDEDDDDDDDEEAEAEARRQREVEEEIARAEAAEAA